ncbi:Choline kinase [Pseudoloma neurophilia]|uniref:Choline kinase n=1 Tax=Pseudoloma neurophilia TaxID=146866 RepID=A0A0R0LZR5_9MICR|nr:Choline kinase [Pseudoloma neurophilia]
MLTSHDKETIEKFLNGKNEILISFIRQKKAYSNIVYTVQSDKKKYIFKKYSHNFRDDEIRILKKLTRPKVYIYGENYRIEEYIEHDKPNLVKDLDLLAKALADFHKLKITKIDTFHDKIREYIIENQKLRFSPLIDKLYDIFEDKLKNIDNSRVLHMDPQLGNLLKLPNSIYLIDFEYSCAGDVAIDINNVFFESMTDYDADSLLKPERGLTEEQKNDFIRSYIKYCDSNLNFNDFKQKCKDLEDLSHFLWYLWGRMFYLENATVSDGFDYLEYPKCRLKMIKDKKAEHVVLELLAEFDQFGK